MNERNRLGKRTIPTHYNAFCRAYLPHGAYQMLTTIIFLSPVSDIQSSILL